MGSSSTTGKAGANKEDSNPKNCDESNNPSKKKSKDLVDGMAEKSASNEGSELLKLGSMISTSIK